MVVVEAAVAINHQEITTTDHIRIRTKQQKNKTTRKKIKKFKLTNILIRQFLREVPPGKKSKRYAKKQYPLNLQLFAFLLVL